MPRHQQLITSADRRSSLSAEGRRGGIVDEPGHGGFKTSQATINVNEIRAEESANMDISHSSKLLRRNRQPSYAKSTISASQKSRKSSRSRMMRGKGPQNLDDSLDQREIDQAIDENSRNSKYRLCSLEKKVETQTLKSKGKIEDLNRKMQSLQNVSHGQQERLR